MEVKTLVSVIIPTFKRVSGLGRALSGVSRQTYQSVEIIVVDDNLDFETSDRVRKICARYKAAYIPNQGHKGGNGARNTGILAARGKYIAFLDDDDYWLEQKLSAQVAFMESENLACSFTGHYRLHQRSGVFIKSMYSDDSIKRENLLSGICPQSLSLVMIRADTFQWAGCFDEELPSFQDFDLFLRVTQKESLYFVNECLAIITEHEAPRVSVDLTNRLRGLTLLKKKLAPMVDANSLSKLEKSSKAGAYAANARRVEHCNYIDALKFRMLALGENGRSLRLWLDFALSLFGAWPHDFVNRVRRERCDSLFEIYHREFEKTD